MKTEKRISNKQNKKDTKAIGNIRRLSRKKGERMRPKQYIFEKIMAENLLKLMEDVNPHISKTQF